MYLVREGVYLFAFLYLKVLKPSKSDKLNTSLPGMEAAILDLPIMHSEFQR